MVKSIEILAVQSRKRVSSARRRGGDLGTTVWATGISVAQTGISVAQTVAALCRLEPSPRRLASICGAVAVHVLGRKTHVLRIVCKKCGDVQRALS